MYFIILHTQAVSRRRIQKKRVQKTRKHTTYLQNTKTIIIQTSHSARRQCGALYLHPSILYLSIFVSVYTMHDSYV